MPKLAPLLGLLLAAGPVRAQVRFSPSAGEGPAVPVEAFPRGPSPGAAFLAAPTLVPLRLSLPELGGLSGLQAGASAPSARASAVRPVAGVRRPAAKVPALLRHLEAKRLTLRSAAALRSLPVGGRGEDRGSAETAQQAAALAFDLNGLRETLPVEAPEGHANGVLPTLRAGEASRRGAGLNAAEPPPPPAPRARPLRAGLIIGLGVSAGAAALWIFAGASGLATAATSAAVGLLLGMRHATDADHVIAVANVVSRAGKGRGAWKVGALWGVGHTATLLAVGGAIILLKASFPETVAQSFEAVVAGVLVLLGAANMLTGGRRYHGHDHDHAAPPGIGRAAQLKAVGLGLIHGLAGSAAVALLILATIPSRTLAMVYLGMFGLGTIAGMTVMTVAMGLSLSWLTRRAGFERKLAFAAGLVSLLFGLYMLYRIGFVDGLFL